jgi:hypothetical protein
VSWEGKQGREGEDRDGRKKVKAREESQVRRMPS